MQFDEDGPKLGRDWVGPWTLLLLGLVLTAVAAFFLRAWTLTNR